MKVLYATLVAMSLAIAGLSASTKAAQGAPGDPCCNIVKFDVKTRIVTIREIATNREYTCQAKDAKELQDVKVGQQLVLNVSNLQRVGAVGQAASSGSATKQCPGGWNGPRGGDTRPTAPPTKPK